MINKLPRSLIEAATKVLLESHHLIDVDGEIKHRHNSNGEPIHPTDEGIRNFHRWFNGSKAVDEHGRPLVVYHGSDNEFENFSPEKIGSNNDSGYLGRGFYFSTSKNTARSYQSDLDKEPKAFYLKLKNPQKGGWFSGEGYLNATKFSGEQDGAMWEHEDYDNPGETGSIEYVVKEPHQIKSATFNNGNFQHSDHVNESFYDHIELPKTNDVKEVNKFIKDNSDIYSQKSINSKSKRENRTLANKRDYK